MLHDRGHWSSRLGFVLAAAGSAIGLGNLWKFPYVTWDNGGGVFVLVYLVCIAAVGLPIMMAEILVGRSTQRSVVGALKEAIGPAWGLVGGLGVLTGFVILGYYTVIAGWALRYFYDCLRWSLGGFDGEALQTNFGLFVSDGTQQVTLSAVFMVLTVVVVMRGISGGIEKAARVLMPALFVILVLMLFSSLSMEGAGEALAYMFAPDFSQFHAGSALEALGQAFFSLSLGMGAMITYGSYLSRDESVPKSAGIVVLLDTLIAITAAVIMFAVIFSVPGMQEALSGSTAGMLFITLPSLFYTQVPFGVVLAPLFYLLVCFAALTSTISLLEVVASYFIDERRWSRAKATIICGIGVFVLSLLCALSFGASEALSSFTWVEGKNGLFDHLDFLAANWFLTVGGLLITIGVGWVLSRSFTERELTTPPAPRWFNYPAWLFFIRFVAPLAVAAIIVAVILGADFT